MPHLDTNTIWMIVALGLAIGLGLANFRRGSGDVADNTIKALQAQIQSLKDEVASLHRENKEQGDQMVKHQAQIHSQQELIAILSDQVKGIPDWAKLHAGLDTLQTMVAPLAKIAASYSPDTQARYDAHMEDTATIRRILEARRAARPKVVE